MKQLNISQKSILVLFVALAINLSGCASTKSVSPQLQAKSLSGDGVQIQSVHFRSTDKGLEIYGKVVRMKGYFNSPQPRHLDVTVRGPQDNVLSQIAVAYFPNPFLDSRRFPASSSYITTISTMPPAGSMVLVMVHPTLIAKCPLASVGD